MIRHCAEDLQILSFRATSECDLRVHCQAEYHAQSCIRSSSTISLRVLVGTNLKSIGYSAMYSISQWPPSHNTWLTEPWGGRHSECRLRSAPSAPHRIMLNSDKTGARFPPIRFLFCSTHALSALGYRALRLKPAGGGRGRRDEVQQLNFPAK